MAVTDLVGSMFDGWQRYPRNLSISQFDAGLERCSERLNEDMERLFVAKEADCDLKVLSILSHEEKAPSLNRASIKSPEQLESFLKQKHAIQIFQIEQEYSWGPLLITGELFLKLLTALRVHPGLLEVVHSFGEKITAVEESFAALFTQLYPEPPGSQTHSYEIAYTIKYVARHGRTSPEDPFSVRQTGIYDSFQASSSTSVWIHLQPSESLSTCLAKALEDEEVSQPISRLQYHAFVFLCLSENWRDYVNYLEDSFSNLMDRGFLSEVKRTTRDGIIDTDFGDIRRLQIMTDKLKRLIHLLDLNRNVCKHLQTFFARVVASSHPVTVTSFHQYETMMERCNFQLETHTSQLRTMVSRAEGVGNLIEHILDIRTAESNHAINCAMHDIAKQSAEENKLVRLLASQSTQDTRSMKVVALISSIFLPATFVATFFGSNFFGFEQTKDGHSLAMASNVWIYIIVALAVSAMAIALWHWWYSRSPTLLDRDVDLECR